MGADALAKWKGRLYSRLPLLGGWLRLRAVRKLAEDDSPEAVRLLAEAVARSDDRRVAVEALEALQQVSRPRCVAAVCEIWASTRHPHLERLLAVCEWVPRAPVAVRVLWRLAHRQVGEAAAGGAEVVGPLLRARADADAELAGRARQALQRLPSPEARDELCRLAVEGDDALAREVAVAAGYAPRGAGPRALFWFLTGQWERYESLDFDRALLRAVYQAADDRLRRRIAAKAREAGRVEWVEVVTGGRQSLRLGEMTDAEWQAVLDVLVAQRQWPELWRLAQEAPGRWSARLLQYLPTPEGATAEREAMRELVRLAAAWIEPDLSSLTYLRATLTDEEDAVRSLAVSPNGRVLASTRGVAIRLHDLPDGASPRDLLGHPAKVTCVGFSPGGRMLLSGDESGAVRFWAMPAGSPRPAVKRQHAGAVVSLAVSPHGALAATGGSHNDVVLWDRPRGVPLESLPVRATPPSFLGNDVRSLAFSPDEHTLAAVANGVLSLWAVPEGPPLPALPGEAKYGGAIAFSPDGSILAAGLRDGTIEMWGMPNGQMLGRLEGHSGPVECLAWTPDGGVLASGGQDREVRLWRPPDGRSPDVLGGHDAPVTHLAIAPDGRVLASADADGTVELWRLPDGRSQRTLRGDGGRIHCLAVTPDGSLLASGGADGTVRLWASELFPLVRIPAGRMGLEDVGRVHAALGDAALKDAERASLEFIAALVRWRRRFDVHLDDAPQRIAVGEFDIEIAG